MRYYLSFDGGGTKLSGLLFDENARFLAAATTKGVNPNIYTEEQVRDSIRRNVASLLEQSPVRVEAIDTVFVNQMEPFPSVLHDLLPCSHFAFNSEGTLGVLCCGVTDGLCVLSGTGSDVFLVEEGETRDTFGGWGYLLGDEGSGLAIGREAVRSLLCFWEGRIPEAPLHARLCAELGANGKGELLSRCYQHPLPARLIASLCRLVSAAAQAGCPVSLEILQEAGRALGELTEPMYRKQPHAVSLPVCTTGSVLRHCAPVQEALEAHLRGRLSQPPCFLSPLFPPVVGGAASYILSAHGELSPEALDHLVQNSQALAL